MLSSGVWCARVSCASPWGSPNSMAARVPWGNPNGVAPDSNACSVSSGGGVPTPCTRRRSPLRCADISQPDERGGRFNFSGQTYLDPLIALTRRVFLLVYSAAEFLLKLPDISDRHLEIFCFRYLLSKSPNSPCNPPIIGFLSLWVRTKGWITSYI